MRGFFVRRYLNRSNRDDMEPGLLLPSVLSDLTRGTPEAREAFAEGVVGLVAEMASRVPGEDGVTARKRALATAASLIGAMTLARATKGLPLSDEVLEAAREVLLARGREGDSAGSGTGQEVALLAEVESQVTPVRSAYPGVRWRSASR